MNHELTTQITCTGTLVLREFGNQLGTAKDNPKGAISHNFLARTIRQLNAIYLLVQSEFIPDAWSLYRSLLERYFLFVHLCDANDFVLFDNWCFKKLYEFENRLKSSSTLKHKAQVKDRRVSPNHKQRYEHISQDPNVKHWHRPDPQKVAKKLGLKFLYDAGYNYASSFVHPISTDGLNDYLHLMDRKSEIGDEGKETLLSNSHLISILHIQQFLNQPEYNWRTVLYDLLDALRERIKDPAYDCTDMLLKVHQLHTKGLGLSQPKRS